MTARHPIPDAALASHIAILGKTGSGETYAAKSVVERLLTEGGRGCISDPTGAWHGLRSSASAKRAGFPVVIFGGSHADLPLGGAHGEALAEIIGTSSTPAILDTSLMKVGDRTRFFADFADALVRQNKGPLHLVIDEVHLFAPQGKVSDPQTGAMLHAANNLVSLGRSRGLRIVLITQRPAKLHKDSLTQVETLVALRLIAPQHRRAVEDWIEDNADEATGREVIASLATLKTGQGWVWAPELGVLERVTFPKIRTFDASAAPDGAANGAGPVLAAIDRGAIGERLKSVAADAVANDPKALRAEIARLKSELAKAAAAILSNIRSRAALLAMPISAVSLRNAFRVSANSAFHCSDSAAAPARFVGS
jgi:Helicase HerA, central domain